MTQPTAETIAQWRALCEWLDRQPRKAAYSNAFMPYDYCSLLSRKTLQFRKENPLVFYSTGWGWRLRKQWRETLERLENETHP